MCLLKVYVEDGDTDRKLVAQDVAFVSKEGEIIKLKDVEFKEKTLANVDIISIDALSSILILKKKKNNI